jgi:dTDP-L-rhamnose 4-epimerase
VRVLVTGGAGFIGSHTADALLAGGHEVRILDNLLPPVHQGQKPGYLKHEIDFIKGDVRDKTAMAKALEGVDAVYHLAAYQGFLPDYSNFFHTNAAGTAMLFEVIAERKISLHKVIVASSQAVYGEGKYFCPAHGQVYPAARPVERLLEGDWEVKCPLCGHKCEEQLTDEQVVNPETQYAMSKYTQEMIALNLGKRHGIPAVCLRYSITQGPRQSFYNAYSGILRIFAVRMLNGQSPVAYEDGLMKRDYVHIKDVVAANLLVLEKQEADYQVYNVGSGKPITVLEYANKLKERIGTDIDPVLPGEFRLGDVRHIISDVSRLKNLGWTVEYGLDDIIRDYLEWVKSFGPVADHFAQAEVDLKSSGAIRSGR